MERDIEAKAIRFEKLVVLLHDGFAHKVDHVMIQECLEAVDEDSLHQRLAYALFRSLKNLLLEYNILQEDDGTCLSLRKWLTTCVDVQQPFGDHMTVLGLRNWMVLLNDVFVCCSGNVSRLAFKYRLLPMIACIAYHIPFRYPEFLAKLNDYLEQWGQNHIYDSKALVLLSGCLRGEYTMISDALKHAESQIAGHFVLLRQECMQQEETNAIFPAHIAAVLRAWGAGSSDEASSGISVGAAVEDVAAGWYREVMGSVLVQSINERRSELDSKFSLDRFKAMNLVEFRRNMGQAMVLMRREFLGRLQLLQEELQLISNLDSRHAVLVRKHDVYGRLLAELEP
eukprot:Protomagalhaensia_sp_Gyna_25__2984@NODE_275_length_4078_cov_34_820995_g211_i0_p2_GENE_NODE_275_length_4078_cov_34_820995_g211_i0NODE_275_length_4078_cov_34_820995_g211_i0_p2_ORF_typecomplete_len341_score48_18CxC1/PF18802_1/0_054_NODE_275_length_4078_cov_34_820995_g211_i04881510